MEFDIFEGVCRYCGEINPIMAADQRDADLKISDKCSCGGVKIEKKIICLRKSIEEFCGNETKTANFAMVDRQVVEQLKNMGELVIKQKIQEITIKVNGETIKIKATQSYGAKIERKRASGIAMEV